MPGLEGALALAIVALGEVESKGHGQEATETLEAGMQGLAELEAQYQHFLRFFSICIEIYE